MRRIAILGAGAFGTGLAIALARGGAEVALIARNPDRSVKEMLGYEVAMRLVNRNNLVILEDHHLPWDQPEEPLRVIND